MKDIISVQCHTREDAAMYLRILQEEGYSATLQSYSNPKIVDISVMAPGKDSAGLDVEEFAEEMFELYSRRVAN